MNALKTVDAFTQGVDMNGFRKLQQRLREEGWYVGWNLPCCQSCAWGALPDYHDARYDEQGYLVHPETGEELDWRTRDEVYKEIDLSKVLFNHSQDCEFDLYDIVMDFMSENEHNDDDIDDFFEKFDDAREAVEDGHTDAVNELFEKYSMSHLLEELEGMDQSVSGFVCFTPEEQTDSTFCFDGGKKGVANLKAIIPIIEECGCSIHWNGKGDARPTISWK